MYTDTDKYFVMNRRIFCLDTYKRTELSATYDPNRTMFGSVPCVTRTDNLYWLPVTRAKSNGTGNEDEKVESRSMPVTLASVETQRPPRGFSFINIDIWFACTDINVILIKTESR